MLMSYFVVPHPGEQQRLGMARLFFHCPRFGVLDECTNATSVDVEELLYQHAATLGITLVSLPASCVEIPGLLFSNEALGMPRSAPDLYSVMPLWANGTHVILAYVGGWFLL